MIERQHCERCGDPLMRGHEVWLELRTSDNTWHLPGVMADDDPDNQGGFPFGATCAEHALTRGQDW